MLGTKSQCLQILLRILVSIVEKNIFMKIIKIKKNSSYLV